MHEIGLRPGEKLHEEMISPEEGRRALRSATGTSCSPTSRPGATSRRPTASRCRTASPTARTATTSGSPREEIREILRQRASDVLPYGRQSIDEADVEAVTAVLRGDWLTTGPAVDRVRGRPSPSWPADTARVSCTSGTAALHIAYAAAGPRPGDEVVTTPMTFVATASRRVARSAPTVVVRRRRGGHRQPRPGRGRRPRSPTAPGSSPPSTTPATRPTTTRCSRSPTGAGALLLDDAAHSIGGHLPRPPGRRPGRPHHVLVLPDQEPHHRRGRRGRRPRTPTLRDRAARVPQHRPGPRPGRGFAITGRGPLAPGGARVRPELPAARRALRARAAASCAGSPRSRQRRRRDRRRATTRRWPTSTACGLPTSARGVDPAWHLYPLRVLDGRRREVFDRHAGRRDRRPGQLHPGLLAPGLRATSATGAACARSPSSSTREELSLPLFPDLTDADVDRVIDQLASALRG